MEDLQDRVAALEARLQELDALINLVFRLMSLAKPVSSVLEQFGATETEDRAVHALLDDLAKRVEKGGMYAPSFGGFMNELVERFPAIRGNRQFVSLLLDTLKVDRPAYQRLHDYTSAQGWPQWT
jgi:hypothetical protein